ncbi:MAG: hypothetical protein Fur0041_18810 [Bacteroidia bacterium]
MKTKYILSTAAAAVVFFSAGLHAQTLQEAIRMTENEQYEKAKVVFRKLIAAEPTNGDNYYYFGDLMMKADDPDSAFILFKKGMDINPTNPLTHVGMGRFYFFTGKNEEGQKEFAQTKALVQTQAGKKGTDLPAARQSTIYLEMAKAFVWASVPNYDEAISLTQTAERLDPKNAEVFLVRGDAFMKKDQVNASPAIAEYKKAAALDPKSSKANLRIGQLYAAGKNMPSAISFYNLALKTEPNFAPAWREMGEAYYQLTRFDSASVCYDKYLGLNDDPWARYRYCAFLYKSGNYDKAIEEGSKALAADSSISVIYRIVGRSYMEKKTKEADKAIMFMNLFFAKQKQIGKPKLIADDYITRGRAYSEAKKDSVALIDFNEALKMDSARNDIFFEMGTSYFKMKKYSEAAYYYKKKIDTSKKPSLTDLNAWGRALYLNKDYANADSAFKRMTEIDPNNPTGWFWRGKANSMLDPKTERAQARPYYEKYFDLAIADKEKNKKDLVTAAQYLAGIHYINKNFACSKAYFQFVLELDPANKDVKTQLETDKDIKAAQAAEIGTCKLQETK